MFQIRHVVNRTKPPCRRTFHRVECRGKVRFESSRMRTWCFGNHWEYSNGLRKFPAALLPLQSKHFMDISIESGHYITAGSAEAFVYFLMHRDRYINHFKYPSQERLKFFNFICTYLDDNNFVERSLIT